MEDRNEIEAQSDAQYILLAAISKPGREKWRVHCDHNAFCQYGKTNIYVMWNWSPILGHEYYGIKIVGNIQEKFPTRRNVEDAFLDAEKMIEPEIPKIDDLDAPVTKRELLEAISSIRESLYAEIRESLIRELKGETP